MILHKINNSIIVDTIEIAETPFWFDHPRRPCLNIYPSQNHDVVTEIVTGVFRQMTDQTKEIVVKHVIEAELTNRIIRKNNLFPHEWTNKDKKELSERYLKLFHENRVSFFSLDKALDEVFSVSYEKEGGNDIIDRRLAVLGKSFDGVYEWDKVKHCLVVMGDLHQAVDLLWAAGFMIESDKCILQESLAETLPKRHNGLHPLP